MPTLQCFKCQTSVEFSRESPISRSSSCPQCLSDLKTCKNCRHYDASARWECREEIQEAVREKERANFCDFFQPREFLGSANSKVVANEPNPRDALLKNAEALFKKN